MSTTLRVTLARPICGSMGSFNTGDTQDFPADFAKSLVSQGAATPVNWKYEGKLSSLAPAPFPMAATRDQQAETAVRSNPKETAATRKGKPEPVGGE